MIPLSLIGVVGWRLLHLAVLPFLGWRLAVVTLLAWPFWQDFQVGGVLTFAFVLAALALQGRTWAGLLYIALALLTPRPILFPAAVWIIATMPQVRIPTLVMAASQGAVVAGLGYLDDWVIAATQPGADFASPWDYGPGGIIGPLWVGVGLIAAAVLLSNRRVGLASLAASPYWLGYYLLMLLLELPQRQVAMQAHDQNVQRPPVS
jgi:hypothetical protein